MLRILRAFAWLRWRMFVNALEKTGSRDMLERFSLAIEKLGPILAGILLIPSALGLLGVGIFGGYTTAADSTQRMPLEAVRYLLFAAPLLAIFGPLFLPAADRTNPVRLLLLPIPRGTLYVAQASAAFGDPWVVLMIPLVVGVAIGVAIGGTLAAAALCLAAALLLVVLVVGLSALATSVIHLVARDRRRGELVALLFIIVIPVISMLPGLLGASSRERGKARSRAVPAWVLTAGNRVAAVYPTEIFIRGTRAGAAGDLGPASASVGALAASTLALNGIGFLLFRRVLDSPGSSGARRSAPMRAAWSWRLPGLSSGASAVATAQLRLALRTPRGRSIMLSPLMMFVIFGIMLSRGSGTMDFGALHFDSGISLATFTSAVAVLSILPIAMNQFAVDRAGFTMALLSPLTERELLAGKAAGNALIAAPTTLACMILVMVFFPTGPLVNWLTLLLALISVYIPMAPVAAIFSAVFPREVDMNSIGRGSNAHGAAGLLGLVSFLAAGVPPAALTFAAVKLLDQPNLAPLFLLVWCVVAAVAAKVLFDIAARIFAARRENLALTV